MTTTINFSKYGLTKPSTKIDFSKYGLGKNEEIKKSYGEEPQFKASIGGVGTIFPNIAKTIGNIPSNIANIANIAATPPVEALNAIIPSRRPEDVGKFALKDIFQNGAVQGVKDLAGGFGEVGKKIFKTPGEFLVEARQKKALLDKLAPLQEKGLKQRDDILNKIAKAREAGKDTSNLSLALKYTEETLKTLDEQVGSKADRELKSTQTATNIAKFPIERPLEIPLALETGGPKSNISKVASPITRGADTRVSAIIEEGVSKLKGTADASIKANLSKEVDNLFKSKKSIENGVKLAQQKNTDLRKIMSDPQVFKGLKVEKGTINPDLAIENVDGRIDVLLNAKKDLLPEIDKFTIPKSREVVRQKALAEVKGSVSPADEQDLINAINKQVDALPETLNSQQLDVLRAQFRQSARNAKGLQKSASEYSALENATRDTLFEHTDNLPFDTNGEIASLNTQVKDLINAKIFLDKTLRGQKMKGAFFGNLFARGMGAVVGSKFGVFGTILGAETSGAIFDIMLNNQLGSSLKLKLIRNISDDPRILNEVEKVLKQAQDYDVFSKKALPAGAIPMGAKSGESGVEVIKAGKGQVGIDPKTGRFLKTFSSTGEDYRLKPNITGQNIANNMTTKVSIFPKSTTKKINTQGWNKANNK